MRRLVIAALFTMLTLPAFAADEPKAQGQTLDEQQKTFYALGLYVAQQVSAFDMTPAESELMIQGLSDALAGKKPVVELDAYNPKIQALRNARTKIKGEKLAEASKAYLEKAAQEKGAVKTSSGLIFRSLAEGTGASPAVTDTVKVNYRGTLVDGKEFDSSYKRGQPAEFPLNGVIKCWTEGVQLMKPGGKAQLVCPPAIAYGERGAGGLIPPNATLVFEVELLEVKKK